MDRGSLFIGDSLFKVSNRVFDYIPLELGGAPVISNDLVGYGLEVQEVGWNAVDGFLGLRAIDWEVHLVSQLTRDHLRRCSGIAHRRFETGIWNSPVFNSFLLVFHNVNRLLCPIHIPIPLVDDGVVPDRLLDLQWRL